MGFLISALPHGIVFTSGLAYLHPTTERNIPRTSYLAGPNAWLRGARRRCAAENWAPSSQKLRVLEQTEPPAGLAFNCHTEERPNVEVAPVAGGKVDKVAIQPEPVEAAYPSGGLSVSPDASTLCLAGLYRGAVTASGRTHLSALPVEGAGALSLP